MEKLIQIEQYLTGTLNAQDAVAFEQQMQSDPDLATEVQSVRDLIDGIDLAGRTAFEAKVASWEASLQQTSKRGRVMRPQWVRFASVAAAAIAILLAVYFVGINNQGTDPSQLFTQNFSPYPDELTIMGNGDDTYDQSLANRAMTFYKDQNYPEAVLRLDSLIAQAPGISLFQLYKGISHIELKEYDLAKKALGNAAQSGGLYTHAAEWYLALTMLGEGNIESAKTAFQSINAQKGHFYQLKAKQVLNSL